MLKHEVVKAIESDLRRFETCQDCGGQAAIENVSGGNLESQGYTCGDCMAAKYDQMTRQVMAEKRFQPFEDKPTEGSDLKGLAAREAMR